MVVVVVVMVVEKQVLAFGVVASHALSLFMNLLSPIEGLFSL